MNSRLLIFLTILGVSPCASFAGGIQGISIDPDIARPDSSAIKASPQVISLQAPGQWFGSGVVTVDLELTDISDGIISFWIHPLGAPVTAIPRHTNKDKVPGISIGFPDKHALVEAGDLKKPFSTLRIEVDAEGHVTADHLSWHNDQKWLAGVSTPEPALSPGQWTHVAYGIGKSGQRLWINGALVAQNSAGTQSVSWPFQLRINRTASFLADFRLTRDESAALAGARTPPEVDPQPAASDNGDAAPVDAMAAELLTLITENNNRANRLSILRSRQNLSPDSLPYEQARLNILRRLAPLALHRLLLESTSPAPVGVDLHALAHSEARWILDTARLWDAHLVSLASGETAPLATPRIVPDTSTLTVRNGAFWQNDRPVYFVGMQDPRYDLTQGLGFTFTGHTVGPHWEVPSRGQLARTGRDQQKRAEQAEANGQFWDILYSGHIFPAWIRKEQPALRVGTGFMSHDMLAPAAWEIHKTALESILADLTAAKNILGFDLANEPAFNGYSAESLPNWRAWLQRHHGTIKTLNQRWGASYADWADIPVPDFVNTTHVQPWGQKFITTPGPQLARYVDWSRFNLERVNNWFADVNRIAKTALPHTFTYTKMIQSTTGNARMGIDVIANIRTTDLNGSDSWWVFNGFDQNQVSSADRMSGTQATTGRSDYSVGWQHSLMLYDLLTGARPEAPAANAEFHLFSDTYKPMSKDYPSPPPGHWDRHIPWNHFYAGIWQQAIHGQAMSNLWTHWPRNNITERAEALDAASRAAMDLNRLAPEVHALHTAARPVAILWGLTPVLCDTSGQWTPSIDKPWRQLWESVTLNGHRPDYVLERDLADGKLPDPARTKVILAGSFRNISADALRGLIAAQKSGIQIWTIDDRKDRQNLTHDPYNHPHTGPALQFHPNRVIDIAAYEQNSFAEIRTALTAANLLPSVQVLINGTPTPLVHYRSATAPGGRHLTNLCNYARHEVTASIRTSGIPRSSTQATDLITGEIVNLDRITLGVQQVRLLQF
ncbi:glycoside hydrolase family 42 [Opitutaceae bacterium TAV5]|nr:glycoside hydrolase family 42 [Opitutaceae bacterium TAV5]